MSFFSSLAEEVLLIRKRSVITVKEECLAKLILFGESSLRRALQEYLLHYHEERNHQGKRNRSCFLRGQRQEGTLEQCGVENGWWAC